MSIIHESNSKKKILPSKVLAKLTTHAANEYKVKIQIRRKQSLAIENSGQRDGNF